MPTATAILADLKKLGKETHRKTYIRHGMTPDKIYGVPMPELAKIAKKIKGEQALACELFDTGIVDAEYLAGLVVDGSKMTKKQLQSWADGSGDSALISEFAVPNVTVKSPDARDLAMKWIGSKKEHVACCGWTTYSRIVAATEDGALDLAEIEQLLNRVVKEIGAAQNRVRYTMNGFVIAVGSYVKPLLKQAKVAAQKIGVVSVNMGDTACKVPLATEYIAKAEAGGKGKKG
jgi:3-methyladenine DNA glycosylase AlkD